MPRLFPDYKFTDRHSPDSIIQTCTNRAWKMAAGKVVVGKKTWRHLWLQFIVRNSPELNFRFLQLNSEEFLMCLVTTAAAAVVGEVAVAVVVVVATWEELAAAAPDVAAAVAELMDRDPSASTPMTLLPSSLSPWTLTPPGLTNSLSTSSCRRTQCKSSGRASEEPTSRSGQP